MSLRTTDYDYTLPDELIARFPPTARDGARMLVLHREERRIEHCLFSDFERFLLPGEMRQWLETESRILRPGDTLYIPRGVIHGCKNEQATPCEFLAILTPGKIVGPLSVDYSSVEPWASLL